MLTPIPKAIRIPDHYREYPPDFTLGNISGIYDTSEALRSLDEPKVDRHSLKQFTVDFFDVLESMEKAIASPLSGYELTDEYLKWCHHISLASFLFSLTAVRTRLSRGHGFISRVKDVPCRMTMRRKLDYSINPGTTPF